MKWFFGLGVAIPTLALTLIGSQVAFADDCYDFETTVCIGGKSQTCTTERCCKTEYVPQQKPDGSMGVKPVQKCRDKPKGCHPNGEACEM